MKPQCEQWSRRSLFPLGLLAAAGGTWKANGAEATGGAQALRIGLSDRVVTGVNMNDARAAFNIWSQEILGTSGLKIAQGEDLILPSPRLLAAVRDGKVDLICLTVPEYLLVKDYVDVTRVMTDMRGGHELLLLVRADGPIQTVADLRKRTMVIYESGSTGMAEAWLSVLFKQEGLPAPEQVMARVNRNSKLASVVLPVFFGQMDACIATRQSFDVMVEMNPQLARKLRVLRTSPTMTSTFFACRRSLPQPLKTKILDHVVSAKASGAAKQLLTLFHTTGYNSCDAGCLQTAIHIAELYQRLNGPERLRNPQ